MQEELIQKALTLLAETKDSNYRIAKTTGISETAIGRYKNGKSKPTIVNAKVLLQYFEVGEEEIITLNEPLVPYGKMREAQPISDIQFMQIPYIPIHAQGGYPRGYGDQEYIDQLPTMPVIVDRNYRGKYRIFEVSGDSMDDGTRNALCDGDKILCREVKRELWRDKLHIKDWYFVIVCRRDGITVKQIVKHDIEKGKIYCHPLNPLFEDFVLKLDDVVELYNVIKIIDRTTRI